LRHRRHGHPGAQRLFDQCLRRRVRAQWRGRRQADHRHRLSRRRFADPDGLANRLRRPLSMTTMRRPFAPTGRWRAARGFTLVELVVVIVITAVIGTTIAIYVKPTMDAYIDIRGRADLADQADTSLRRMLRDVRHAVSNSLRLPNTKCFELVPAVSGGRYRMGPDVVNDNAPSCSPSSTCAAYVDSSQPSTVFDTLSVMTVEPAQNDWVVINNQNGNDVYTGANRAQITAVANAPSATQGHKRLTIDALQVSPGYNGGRFQIVKNGQQSVFYICSGADGTLNGSGNGKGTLYRLVRN